MTFRAKVRPILASVIIASWLIVELWYGAIENPTLELRLILVSALIWMFGESVTAAVNIIRGGDKQ